MTKPQRLGRPAWSFVGNIQLRPYVAGERPLVLFQAPVSGLSRLTPAQARELAWAIYSAADSAEILAERNHKCHSPIPPK